MRARDLGIKPGILPTGVNNSITDVDGVLVGHCTIIEEPDIHTGATAILPHGGNLYQDKVPAGLAVGNGFGKMMGATQIQELGEIETPIVLTNTLSIPQAAGAVIDWTLEQHGNEQVMSVNPVVGETNDGGINDIRRRFITRDHVLQAIRSAASGPVAEGAVGAGTGTCAFGWKGGIGTSSRRLPINLGGFTVGVLVQTNFGGVLQILGIPVGEMLGQHYLRDSLTQHDPAGSIMMVVATDAPLSDRNLRRLAARAITGLARTGSSMTNGSGDYAIAFSTAEGVRRTPERRQGVHTIDDLPNEVVSPLFHTAIEATEEAIYNSMFAAVTVTGFDGKTVEALPIGRVLELLGRIN